MISNEQRAHDFAMAVVKDRLARDEKCELADLIGEYNVAYTEMIKELNQNQES